MFCRYYVQNGHNGAAAAISAGYSKKYAKDSARDNFKNLNITEFLNELEKPVLDKLALDEDWVLTKLKNFIDTNINDFFDFDPQTNKIQLKDMKQLPAEKTGAIEWLKETKYGIEIKLVNKRACVVNIGKHLGMFKQQLETSIDHNPTDMVFVVPAFDIDDADNTDAGPAGN
jgi:phage terminase small subunit